MGKKKEEVVVKLVIVGGGGVGKSSLTLQYMYGDFREDYDPTQVDSYRKKVQLDGQEVLLDILDTAGQEDYAAMRDQYYRTGECFMLVFALTIQSTFNEAPDFFTAVSRVLDDSVPFLLVGNKADLVDERQVSLEAAKQLAADHHCEYLETSAKSNTNVAEAFMMLTSAALKHRGLGKQESKKKKKKSGGGGGGCQLQ